MDDPNVLSLNSGVRANDELAVLMAGLGTAKHPDGAIMALYRRVTSLIIAAYAGGTPDMALIREALSLLRRESDEIISASLDFGKQIGTEMAIEQLGYFGIDGDATLADTEQMELAFEAARLTVSQQIVVIASLVTTGATLDAIIGTKSGVGVLRPAPVVNLTFLQSASLANVSAMRILSPVPPEFRRSAVATIDAVTTDTCVNVNGQIVAMDEAFHLHGKPTGTMDMMNPPFPKHPCRTMVSLFHPEFTTPVRVEETRELNRVYRDRAAAQRLGIDPPHPGRPWQREFIRTGQAAL